MARAKMLHFEKQDAKLGSSHHSLAMVLDMDLGGLQQSACDG